MIKKSGTKVSLENIENKNEEDENEYSIKIQFKVGKYLINKDLASELSVPSFNKITPQYIINALGEDPSLVGRWNMLLNEATEEYENEKVAYDVWEANKFSKYKKLLSAEEGGKAPSDTKINKRILQDPEYLEKNQKLNRLKKHTSHLKAVANSFSRKGDKITTIASLLKFELTRSENPGNKYKNINKPD